MIIAGENVYPEDIEDAVSRVEGVIPGRVIAFGMYDAAIGTEQCNVIAETKVEDKEQRSGLIQGIIRAGMKINVTIRKVHLVEPKWLIKSSSGEPSRSINKGRILP